MDNIFLVAKNGTEFEIFQTLFGESITVFDQADSDEWGEIFEKINGKICLLYHFAGLSHRHEYCTKILEKKERFAKYDLHIIPISEGGHEEKATKLLTEINENQRIPNLDDYIKFWQEACDKFKKKKIFSKIMVLGIYLEIAYKTNLQIRKKEIKKLSREIASNVLSDEVVKLYPILETYRKHLSQVERMNDTDFKKFITYIKKIPATKIKHTAWMKMLRKLKAWAYA